MLTHDDVWAIALGTVLTFMATGMSFLNGNRFGVAMGFMSFGAAYLIPFIRMQPFPIARRHSYLVGLTILSAGGTLGAIIGALS